jgi:hypothetical protein
MLYHTIRFSALLNPQKIVKKSSCILKEMIKNNKRRRRRRVCVEIEYIWVAK